jgi:hypothetical protein
VKTREQILAALRKMHSPLDAMQRRAVDPRDVELLDEVKASVRNAIAALQRVRPT